MWHVITQHCISGVAKLAFEYIDRSTFFIKESSRTNPFFFRYVIFFFPPNSMRRFKARRCYKDRVLMPTINCLLQCVNLEELYLEKADSPAITTYLLAHILKYLTRLRVLALPKQCDDDVAAVVGINCPKLECIILTGTAVTNVGLSWLLCCRQLHTLIMPGFFQGVTPKGDYV